MHPQNPELEPEEYSATEIWCDTRQLPYSGVGTWECRCRVVWDDGAFFETQISIDRLYADTTGDGRSPSDIACGMASAWAHALIDLQLYEHGVVYHLSTTSNPIHKT